MKTPLEVREEFESLKLIGQPVMVYGYPGIVAGWGVEEKCPATPWLNVLYIDGHQQVKFLRHTLMDEKIEILDKDKPRSKEVLNDFLNDLFNWRWRLSENTERLSEQVKKLAENVV